MHGTVVWFMAPTHIPKLQVYIRMQVCWLLCSLHHVKNGGDFGFLELQKIDGRCRQDTHSLCTSVQYRLFTSAERTPRAWLRSHGLQCHPVLHMFHPCWTLPDLPFTTSTSSSSFTLPSTTTPEHAAQPVQHNQLREHPGRHAHLQALPVDKLRHQESLWREDLKIILEIHFQVYDAQIWRRRSPGSDHLRSEGIWRNWDSRLTGFWNTRNVILRMADAFRRFRGKHCRFWSQGWRVTEDADFTTLCPESFGESRCNGRAEERGKCTIHASRAKGKFEVSCMWRSESFGDPMHYFHPSREKLIRSSVFRHTSPSNLRGSLLESNKDHLLNQARSDLAKQELHVKSLNKCNGELQRQTEERKLAL